MPLTWEKSESVPGKTGTMGLWCAIVMNYPKENQKPLEDIGSL